MDYVLAAFVAIFILSTAYFPYADGVRCRSDNINSCSVDTAVTENICELGNIFSIP